MVLLAQCLVIRNLREVTRKRIGKEKEGGFAQFLSTSLKVCLHIISENDHCVSLKYSSLKVMYGGMAINKIIWCNEA